MLRRMGTMVVGLALFTALGCGSSNTIMGTVPVSGTVTLDGSPVQGATVTFAPSGKGGQTASGITDASGRYKLTTRNPNDGAVPGSYSVTVMKMESAASETSTAPMSKEESMKMAQEMTKKAQMGARAKPKAAADLLPGKYKDAKSSGFTAQVSKDNKREFNFDMTSK